FSMLIFGPYARFIRWDHRGAVVTCRFDYTKHPFHIFNFYLHHEIIHLTINDALDSSSEPATSMSTIKTSTADPMLSVPANAVAASTQVIQVAGRAFKM
ncbi:hypothetical protein BYT27DRAFT_7085295, partial [Phlegmacium glaucopus]